MFCSRCGEQVDTSSRFCPRCGQDLTALTGAGRAGATTPITAQPQQENETDIVRDALKDEYELEKELGRGGMAVVYKAKDKQLDREVAIKVLPFSLSFDAEFVERFQREARTAGKLEHPNIIPIYRVGRSGRVIYFVMKFIRGKSLSGVIEQRGALPVAEIKRMLTESAGALGYAHKHGIVHRDIKPDNIMFDELGQAIVADFGIAKAQSGAKLTGTGMSIGTPHYMSPEQARAQNLDGRSDLYSLGVVAYQCLTGHVPFDGEDSFSIGYKHIMEELPVPSLESPEQREIFPIIQKMMAKKPDDRYQTAEEVIKALEGGVHAMDLSTMPTRAIEPLKAPAKPAASTPPMTSAPTTPLPRASASMGKPKEADRPAAKPERSSTPERPSFKPKEVTPKKSSAVPITIAAILVLALGGLGYWKFVMNNPAPQPTPVAANPIAPQSATSDSAVRDTSKAAHDTAHAAAPAPAPPPPPPPSSSSKRPGTSRTHTAPPPAPPPAAPPASVPATLNTSGPHGTVSVEGNIPATAHITIDGVPQTGSHFKVPVGQHTLEIAAQGYTTYSNHITVQANRTIPVPVTMTPATAAAPPAPPAAPGGAAGLNPRCANAIFNLAQRNHCWDTKPSPMSPPIVPAPASCTGRVTPAAILLNVSATGEVTTAAVNKSSSCADFNARAVAQVQDMTFRAATRGGVAVPSWYIIVMQPQR